LDLGGKTLKKYFLAIILLVLVVMASGCTTTNQNSTKSYAANGVSFQYPGSWYIQNLTESNVTTVQLSDPEYNQTNASKGSFAAIIVGPQTSSADLATFRDSLKSEANASGVNSTTNAVNIAGVSANATTFTGKDDSGNQVYLQLIDFTKGNKSFIIFLAAGGGANIDTAKTNFDVIIKSFKVE